MRRHLIVYSICLAVLLTACSTDNGTPAAAPTDEAVVAFDAVMLHGDDATRAANAVNSESDLRTILDGAGFGVFGCYTGLHKYIDSNISPDFMYNEHVTWGNTAGAWQYTPVKYWPNGDGNATGNTGVNQHYVSFFAYAPWSNNASGSPATNPAGYCIPSFSLQGEWGNPWLTYRLINQANLDKQVDLLCALPLTDQTKPEVNTRLPFQFDHALACVGDKVSINCSNDMQTKLIERASSGTDIRVDITKLEIVYTLTSKARLVLWNQGEANWQTIYSEQPTCTRTVTLVEDGHTVVAYNVNETGITPGTNKWDGSGVFYIPTELSGFPQTAQVNLTYRISTYSGSDWVLGIPKEGSVTINLKNYADAYMPGKHLYINVTINDETTSFIVTAAIADWTPGNGSGQDVEAI